MNHYKLIIAYDGTHYHGWQVQPNGITIQEVLQKQMAVTLRHEVQVTGSGRTDSGVHATGQTAHFHTENELDAGKFLNSINALIPNDIRVLSCTPVTSDFHSRYSATGKIYHYHLWLDRFQSPFHRLYSLHVREKIDLELLQKAAQLFLGTHDFAAFANESHTGVASYDSIRTVRRLDLIPQEGGVRIEIEADGFLYKMVRNIVGTLIDCARGKLPIEEIPQIFESKDRRKAGKAAPPHGLFLHHVHY